MTASELYSHRELLELAALDALGLLDEFESDLYTRSYHHASVPLQDQIRRLQAEITSDEHLMPGEEPGRALRERVLTAVAKAIEADDARYQPIARIGRTRDDARPRRRLGGSGQFWRAAAFVLAGVSVSMAYFLADTINRSHELYTATMLNDFIRVHQLLGTTTQDFLLDKSAKIALRSGKSDLDCRGALFVNIEDGEAAILVEKLPRTDGDDYTLQVKLGNGDTRVLGRFFSTGDLTGVKLPLGISAQLLATAVSWEVLDLGGAVVLTSA